MTEPNDPMAQWPNDSISCNHSPGPSVLSRVYASHEPVRSHVSNRFYALAVTIVMGVSLIASPSDPLAAAYPAVPQSDLDAFMQKVLARRDDNWKKLQQYVLDEHEQIDIRALGNVPVWGEKRDYTWYLREGFFVRSPVKVNGVTIGEAERRKYEDNYLKQTKERDKRRGRGQPPAGAAGADVVGADAADKGSPPPTDMESLIQQTRQPEFMDSAYFLKFKFEEAKYALVGRETIEGREVLRIEYYPSRLFSHEQDKQQRNRQQNKTDKEHANDATLERMMNKVSLVTIWVEPKSYQIVKYTFDNVNLDFLPAAWLVHADDLKAAMTMSQPFPDVWLPRDVDMFFSALVAIGSFDVRYHLDYRNYRKAETSSRIRGAGGGR